jgi:sarcosine oxidase subunit beta
MHQTTETLIIGGGVIGSSIAYHLARAGQQVLVVERAGIAEAPAASWASAGGVRRQGRDPAEAALASAAIARWPTLEAELDADVHYRQGGQLLLAETREEVNQLVTFVAAQHTMGFADVRLVQETELRELAPFLAPTVLVGSYSPADGQADPALTTRAFAAAAQRRGATYWLHTACLGLLREGNRVVGVKTSRGEVHAGQTVLAAGAWSDTLAESIGLTLPIRTGVYQMLRSTPATPGLLRPVVGALGRQLSLKQLPDGSFLLGGGWPGDATADRAGFMMREASVAGSWAAASAILPAVGAQQIAASWCGMEAEAFDDVPLIGPATGIEGLFLAVGFSGHGFAIAPAVGEALAEELLGRPAAALGGLRPSRATGFDREAVKRFRAARV